MMNVAVGRFHLAIYLDSHPASRFTSPAPTEPDDSLRTLEHRNRLLETVDSERTRQAASSYLLGWRL